MTRFDASGRDAAGNTEDDYADAAAHDAAARRLSRFVCPDCGGGFAEHAAHCPGFDPDEAGASC